MKKLYSAIFLVLISFEVFSQDANWRVYTATTFIKNFSINSIQSVQLSNKNKGIESNTGAHDYYNSNSIFGNNNSYNALPDNFILTIVPDRKGNMWIGTNSGLAKFDGSHWTVFNTSNSGLPSNIIYSIAIDKDGNIWIGTTEGLTKFDGNSWKVYDSSNSGLPNNVIYSMAIDKNGIKWIGTFDGLAKYDDTTWTVYRTANSRLPDNNISTILIDEKNNKWIGTFVGLAKYDDHFWSVYKTSNSRLPYNDIYSLVSDLAGNIFVETWGGGLAKFNGKKWAVYKTSNSGLPDNNVSSLVFDNSGNMWLGTLSGLVKFNGKEWITYNTSNSHLPDNMVYSLFNDDNGNLWIGTQSGLAIYNENGIISALADLKYFNAEIKNNSIHLVWETFTDANDYGFEIEKRTDKSDWSKIGFVRAKEHDNKFKKYSFVDNRLSIGNNSYRIKQIENSNIYKFSNVRDVLINVPNSYSFELLANKLNRSTTLKYNLPVSTFVTITATDIIGSETITLVNNQIEAGYHEIMINNNYLSKGVYLIRMRAGDFIQTKKMILQNY